ncbi:MAG: hypothetical protein ACFFD3_15700 [Candidatus Thorarchaeota archaeon]
MNSIEMMERFRRFASADLSLIAPNRKQQVLEILLKTKTVRIILTRYEYRTEDLDIEVEVNLPFLPKTSNATAIRKFIDNVIARLEYLKRLVSLGFSLEMLHEEGILIASAVLSKDVKQDMFEALEPPD